MSKSIKMLALLLCMALLLSGCGRWTIDELYCLPERSDAESDLQSVINKAMSGLTYSAPIYGENLQVTQKVDLDGDGVEECLVFAKDTSEKPLKILIFCQLASGYVLMDTIEGYGFAFDFVAYGQVDGEPGMEIIVGRQVSDDVIRSVSVYRFSSGFSRHLLSASYTRSILSDLDGNGLNELLLLNSGESETSDAVLSCYGLEDGQLQRTAVAELSEPVDTLKRLTIGNLQDGTAALFATSMNANGNLVTDIFLFRERKLVNISDGKSVHSIGNYYVYPEDLDGDGIVELPSIIQLPTYFEGQKQQYAVCWDSLDAEGQQTQKQCTYIHFAQGWYMTLQREWIDRLSISRTSDTCVFYIWDEIQGTAKKVMTIYALTDSDRETVAEQMGYTILYEGDAVIYAAALEESVLDFTVTEQLLKDSFHMMRTELNTEEK